MTYKALFLDIDGTILKRDHTYTDLTKKAIDEAQKQGLSVFIATGRPLHEIHELSSELNIDSYIGYNGAYAVHQNNVIVNETMDQDTVLKLVNISKRNQHEIALYTNGTNYFTDLSDPSVQGFIETFQMDKNESYIESIAGDVLGMTAMKLNPTEPSLYTIQPNLRLSQVNVKGVTHAYDILRTNVNKGETIKKVLEVLNIPHHQAIAFGDGMNDKEMFETVGTSFAMENSHPDLFQYATNRTTSVEDSGIYEGLKKIGVI